MRRRKKSKRSHASYVRAGKKAARSRKRKGNPSRHRVTVIKTGRGRKTRLRRPVGWRLGTRKRINPRRRKRNPSRRRRRNPALNLRRVGRTYFGRVRMQNAIMILTGLGGAAVLKAFIINFMPVGMVRNWATYLYGGISIVLGVSMQRMSRSKAVQSAGTGLVIYGIYDFLTTVTPLGRFLPTIGAPEAFSGNYMNYGQQTYGNMMGASLSQGEVEVVGSNIEAGIMPEIIGHDDMGLEDALEMSV